MGGYSNPRRITFSHYFDFGAAADLTIPIMGPKGLKGKIKDINVGATETFNAPTTSAKAQVGVTGSLTSKANADLGTTAAGATYRASAQTVNPITDPDLSADTQYLLTLKAVTGASPTGIGLVTMETEWF